MKLGDVIATVATPIARGLQMPCIDPATNQLRPESGCAQRRNLLNDFSDAIFDRFWTNNNKQEINTMDEEIMFQIVVAVKAKNVEDALSKYKTEGNTLSINPRPQPQVRPLQPTSLLAPQAQK
jgi:uncharacterized protein YcbX